MPSLRDSFEELGYAVLPEVLTTEQASQLRTLCEPHFQSGAVSRPGVRRILAREPRLVEELRATRVPALIREIAGDNAFVIRSILFDKSPDANWLVPWHQDAVIAVRERTETPGFAPWSIKDGEPHCRPTRDILDQVAVLRLSLDPCPTDSGPLLVIPASHRRGLLTSDDLDEAVADGPIVECITAEGGAVLMRPHTVHASARSSSGGRRRVLHLEFTGTRLPSPMQWAEAVTL
jgi:ectoine hydroxylase-related dioxygenase (phytanoyl-CoA dioxygenase family)